MQTGICPKCHSKKSMLEKMYFLKEAIMVPTPFPSAHFQMLY